MGRPSLQSSPVWWKAYSDEELASEGFADVAEVCRLLNVKVSTGYKMLKLRELPVLMIMSKKMTSRFALRLYSQRWQRDQAS